MKIPRHLIAVVSASLAALTVSVGRAAEVSIVDSAPKNGVIAANTAQTPALTIGLKSDDSAVQSQGVTFLVSGSVSVDKIAMPYVKAEDGVPGAAISILIIQLKGTGGSVTDLINKATVMSANRFVLPATMPDGGWLVFDLNDVDLPASSSPYGFVMRFESPAPWRILTLVRANDDIDVSGGISFRPNQGANLVFRSDNDGVSYYNLGPKNMPQFSLVGKISTGP